MVKGGRGHREVGFGSTELKVDVKEGLERYIELLLEKPLKVRAVVLIGSRARGDWKVHSDTDIIVVAEGLPRNHKELLTTLNQREAWPLFLEPRAYTPEGLLEAIWAST
ncbi:MAG: nucleotidyltransferase domain-containing protein [Candidatus Bathyarchaeia archaeon]